MAGPHDDVEDGPRREDPLGDEAVMALEALGFATSAARKAVAAARKGHEGGAPTVQDLIKGALRDR